jgi:hypothetical protein
MSYATHSFYWADWFFVGVFTIYTDIAVSWHCADFCIHYR